MLPKLSVKKEEKKLTSLALSKPLTATLKSNFRRWGYKSMNALAEDFFAFAVKLLPILEEIAPTIKEIMDEKNCTQNDAILELFRSAAKAHKSGKKR